MKRFARMVTACLLAVTALASSNAATFIGDRTDFRDETIYFAMTTRFYDGDPKNNVLSWDKQDVQKSKNDPDWRGDFAGLIEKLDYIKALGFTAIWITPIVQNASGEDYHGYHAMDFSKVDLRYESRKEWGCAKDVKFQDLINAAHAKGIKIILDIVLNHTSNFGEETLLPLFTRNQNIKNQATPAGALIPNPALLSNGYFDQGGEAQYKERFKYFKSVDGDPHNYYHHYGTGWNWDAPSRWWGQIAGDCVDLNTENNTVAEHLVKCYGKFIEMGVDGFRIDTTGHISRLTFNKQFIPQFIALGEKYKDKRLNGCPFYMFGECCARFGGVIYRDQHCLSSHFYTWKSPSDLLSQYNGSQTFWDSQQLTEGHDKPVGPMALCEQETAFNHSSDNVMMKNSRWHEPNYNEASGFNVIDFPMHYNFNHADDAVRVANEGDKYYNDASFNVVYVDSHDYCPGPNDGTRFNGGTGQWAENLALMFTFRGIPCIYYGSEVEFKKGLPIDVGGDNNKTPRSQSGRAYFGEYLKGNVTASDFGVYTADGNVAKTLNADLAQHIIRLNLIRAAVPALRKGQYTFDGCQANGGQAFKRAYKDSYACVAVNGGGTFSNLPAGTYKELVTGETYKVAEGGSITLNASQTQGQVRVAVKDYTGGIIGTDGKFIYKDKSMPKGGSVEFTDPGTTEYYTADDVVGSAAVKFNPAGGSFRTETLTVTATANSECKSAWFKVGNASQVSLTAGASKQFTIGSDMSYGQTVNVTWGATGNDGATYSGSVSYKKVDPNAGITIYVTGKDGCDISGTNIHAWNDKGDLTGNWPGKQLTNKENIGGRDFYYYSFDVDKVNVIFNRNGAQTGNIEGLTGDTYFEYDGGTNASKISAPVPDGPSVTATPGNGSTFTDKITVTLTAKNANTIYYTLNGSTPSAQSTKYTSPITLTSTTTIKTFVQNDKGESKLQSFTYTKTDQPVQTSGHVAYFENTNNWGSVAAYCWDDDHKTDNAFSGKWPGKQLTEKVTWNGKELYVFRFDYSDDLKNPFIIFNNNGQNQQTGDFKFEDNGVYNTNGRYDFNTTGLTGIGEFSDLKVYVQGGQLVIESNRDTIVNCVKIDGTYRQLPVTEGYNYYDLAKGFYIVGKTKVAL